MTPELETRLDVMLGSDLAMAQRNMIHRGADGAYEVFGRWQLQEHGDRVTVSRREQVVCEFSSLRVAVSWCIAEKYNQRELSADIRRLDQDLCRLRDQDWVRRQAAESLRDPDRRVTALIKSQEAHRRYCVIGERLTECARRAKYFQIRGFNDEIARTRRPAPHRTSRDGARKPRRSAH